MLRRLVPACGVVVLLLGLATAGSAAEPSVGVCVDDKGALRIASSCKDKEAALNLNGALAPAQAGRYALFAGTAFIGPVHALEGCTSESTVVEQKSTDQQGNTVLLKLPGGVRSLPCTIEVGLGLARGFYSLLTAEPDDARQDLHIVRVAGGVPTDALLVEDAWPSSVGLTPIDRAGVTPAYLRIRLTNGGATRVPVPSGLTLGSMVEQPIAPSTLSVDIGERAAIADLVEGFRLFHHLIEQQIVDQNGNTRTIEVPGPRDVDPFALGSPPGAAATAALALRNEVLQQPGTATQDDLTLVVRSATGPGQRTLRITVPDVWPTLVEQFERTNGRHHGRYVGHADWTIDVS